MKKGKLIVISGASGVGKGTVLGIMMEKRKDLSFSVSATTRPPRPGEIDGVHYYFITREKFEAMPENSWNTMPMRPITTELPVPRRKKSSPTGRCCWILSPRAQSR